MASHCCIHLPRKGLFGLLVEDVKEEDHAPGASTALLENTGSQWVGGAAAWAVPAFQEGFQLGEAAKTVGSLTAGVACVVNIASRSFKAE